MYKNCYVRGTKHSVILKVAYRYIGATTFYNVLNVREEESGIASFLPLFHPSVHRSIIGEPHAGSFDLEKKIKDGLVGIWFAGEFGSCDDAVKIYWEKFPVNLIRLIKPAFQA